VPQSNRRPVALLEVRGEVGGSLKGGYLEYVALERLQLDSVAEQLAQVLLAAPERWRLGTRRRRRGERPNGAEEAADHPLRRPAQQPDLAAGAAYPHELVGGCLVVGRKHHTDRGDHDVEAGVLERQVLGVGLNPLELYSLSLGAGAAGVEQLRRQIAGDDGRPRGCRGNRGIAGAGSDVEDAHPGPDLAGFDQARPERQ